MKIVYKKNIVEQISEAVFKAREEEKTIDRIVVNEKEMREIFHLLCFNSFMDPNKLFLLGVKGVQE